MIIIPPEVTKKAYPEIGAEWAAVFHPFYPRIVLGHNRDLSALMKELATDEQPTPVSRVSDTVVQQLQTAVA